MTRKQGGLLPSATGFAARRAIAVLRKRNVPVAPLLKRAGMSESDIDNRQARITALAQGKLLEYAAEALGDSDSVCILLSRRTREKRDCCST